MDFIFQFSELKETIGDPTVDTVKLILEIFDYSTLYVFVLEILLKFVDDFWNFWKNFWNIFDFFVTFLVSLELGGLDYVIAVRTCSMISTQI